MPHLMLEPTDDLPLDIDAILLAADPRLAASGHDVVADIRSRAHRLQGCRVRTADAPRAFVHAALALLAGRSDAAQAESSAALPDVLHQHLPVTHLATQPCVSVEQLHGPACSKAAPAPTVSHCP
jgi:5-carboxymethyl-2-hydroxymuconate isomerase